VAAKRGARVDTGNQRRHRRDERRKEKKKEKKKEKEKIKIKFSKSFFLIDGLGSAHAWYKS
jgi:hypothetical protein